MKESINVVGDVEVIIKEIDKPVVKLFFKNSVVIAGKTAFANSLGNNFGGSYAYFVENMIFGNNGTDQGVPRIMNADRNTLFCGNPIISKGVLVTINSMSPNIVMFTSVLDYADVNGSTINEMALKMHSGDLFSMTTNPDLTKTSSMQLTFNWRISIL